jgi:hypothetical protein
MIFWIIAECSTWLKIRTYNDEVQGFIKIEYMIDVALEGGL